MNEKGRKYNLRCEMNRPWLRYSPSDDSAFCSFCIAFPVSVSETIPEVVKVGFRDWKNAVGDKRGALDKHVKSEEHRFAPEKSELVLRTVEGETKSVTESLSKAYQDKLQ